MIRVHIEVGSSVRPWPQLSQNASTLAQALREGGFTVTLREGRSANPLGELPTGSERPPRADIMICVDAPIPVEPTIDRLVFWSHALTAPDNRGWSAVVASSSWHADQLRRRLPGLNVVAIPNGVTCDTTGRSGTQPLDRFLYSSAPERGLHRLLRIWPHVWGRFGLPLSITSDLRRYFSFTPDTEDAIGLRLRDIAGLLDQPGVVVHGPLCAESLLALRRRSYCELYPLEPVGGDADVDGGDLLESAASGLPAVVTPRDCLPSEFDGAARFVESFDPEVWVTAIAEVVGARAELSERALRLAAARPRSTWAETWAQLITSAPAVEYVAAEARDDPTVRAPWRPPSLVP